MLDQSIRDMAQDLINEILAAAVNVSYLSEEMALACAEILAEEDGHAG